MATTQRHSAKPLVALFQPLIVPFRMYLYPLIRGYSDFPQAFLNHGSIRRQELYWRLRFGELEEEFDLSEAWEMAMKERERHRADPEAGQNR